MESNANSNIIDTHSSLHSPLTEPVYVAPDLPLQSELAWCLEDIMAQLDRIDEGHEQMNIIMDRMSKFRALEDSEDVENW
jgi:hypothetical protein